MLAHMVLAHMVLAHMVLAHMVLAHGDGACSHCGLRHFQQIDDVRAYPTCNSQTRKISDKIMVWGRLLFHSELYVYSLYSPLLYVDSTSLSERGIGVLIECINVNIFLSLLSGTGWVSPRDWHREYI